MRFNFKRAACNLLIAIFCKQNFLRMRQQRIKRIAIGSVCWFFPVRNGANSLTLSDLSLWTVGCRRRFEINVCFPMHDSISSYPYSVSSKCSASVSFEARLCHGTALSQHQKWVEICHVHVAAVKINMSYGIVVWCQVGQWNRKIQPWRLEVWCAKHLYWQNIWTLQWMLACRGMEQHCLYWSHCRHLPKWKRASGTMPDSWLCKR